MKQEVTNSNLEGEPLSLEETSANGRTKSISRFGPATDSNNRRSATTTPPWLADTLPFALAAILLAMVSWPMISWWIWEFTRPESYYAHSPLIPLMSGFMLWYRRDQLLATVKNFFARTYSVNSCARPTRYINKRRNEGSRVCVVSAGNLVERTPCPGK
jgi:hypothetical protein